MKSEQRSIAAIRVARVVLVVLIASCALGCTTRKQYAINEAILISERRQLEDEIYRAKFELRDVLEENDRLRKQLDGEGERQSRSKKNARANEGRLAPFDSQEYDGSLFPGGDSLQVAPTKPRVEARTNNNAAAPAIKSYQGEEEVEYLPNFLAVPDSKKTSYRSAPQKRSALAPVREIASTSAPKAKIASAQYDEENAPKKRPSIGQALYEERVDELDQEEYEEEEYDENVEPEYYEEESENYEEEEEELEDWSPLPQAQ